MRKYIQYFDCSGIFIEKEYSNITLIDVLHLLDNSQKKMAVMDIALAPGGPKLGVVFYNNKPKDNDATKVYLCDVKSVLSHSPEIRKFIEEIEILISAEFPEKSLYSQTMQARTLLDDIFPEN